MSEPMCTRCGVRLAIGGKLCAVCVSEGAENVDERRTAIDRARASAREAIASKMKYQHVPRYRSTEERARDYPTNRQIMLRHASNCGIVTERGAASAICAILFMCDEHRWDFDRILVNALEQHQNQALLDEERKKRGYRGLMMDELAARETERASLRRESEHRKRRPGAE